MRKIFYAFNEYLYIYDSKKPYFIESFATKVVVSFEKYNPMRNRKL